MKCSFCGYEFSEEQEGIKGCTGCPLAGHCGKVKCPRCGYEMVKSSGLFRWLKKGGRARNGRRKESGGIKSRR